LGENDEPILDSAVYHCQQCGEKAVKGFLLFHNCAFEKTHDVGELVELAIEIEDGFELWLDKAEFLTPFATEYRYPGDDFEPDKEIFDEALSAAGGLYNYVFSLLPLKKKKE
jgi:HEPN domain-containing protein